MRVQRLAASVLGLAVALAAPSTADASTISLTFIGGTPSATTTGGGDITQIVRAAADLWELAFQDPFSLELSFGWATLPESSANHTLLSQGGAPNRETVGAILFDNTPVEQWFLDPTPYTAEEYSSYNTTAQDFGAGEVNTGRFYLGATGPAAEYDLYSTAVHEIGHALGISLANASFLAESADGDIDVLSPLPYAGSSIPLAFNNAGVTSHLSAIAIAYGSVMAGLNYGERRLPSVVDILTDAQLSGFHDLNLDLTPPPPPTPVPEPTSMVLVGTTVVVFALHRARQHFPRRHLRRRRTRGS